MAGGTESLNFPRIACADPSAKPYGVWRRRPPEPDAGFADHALDHANPLTCGGGRIDGCAHVCVRRHVQDSALVLAIRHNASTSPPRGDDGDWFRLQQALPHARLVSALGSVVRHLEGRRLAGGPRCIPNDCRPTAPLEVGAQPNSDVTHGDPQHHGGVVGGQALDPRFSLPRRRRQTLPEPSGSSRTLHPRVRATRPGIDPRRESVGWRGPRLGGHRLPGGA